MLKRCQRPSETLVASEARARIGERSAGAPNVATRADVGWARTLGALECLCHSTARSRPCSFLRSMLWNGATTCWSGLPILGRTAGYWRFVETSKRCLLSRPLPIRLRWARWKQIVVSALTSGGWGQPGAPLEEEEEETKKKEQRRRGGVAAGDRCIVVIGRGYR